MGEIERPKMRDQNFESSILRGHPIKAGIYIEIPGTLLYGGIGYPAASGNTETRIFSFFQHTMFALNTISLRTQAMIVRF